jgi:hypothetical protein
MSSGRRYVNLRKRLDVAGHLEGKSYEDGIAEEPENLLLEYMRRLDARQARFEDALRNMSARLSLICISGAWRWRGWGKGSLVALDGAYGSIFSGRS